MAKEKWYQSIQRLWNRIGGGGGGAFSETERIGRKGEAAAARWLQRQGYRILARNYRVGKGEIDLVARKQNLLIFVEVKTRAQGQWTRPAQAVDAQKRRILSHTALRYLKEIGNPPLSFRFDVIEVIHDQGRVCEIRQIENAFPLVLPLRYGA